MLKKSLFAITLVALLSVSLSAGEIKVEAPWPGEWTWSGQPIPIDPPTIPVYMDVSYWIEIVNQEDLEADGITLDQVSIHNYAGCVDVEVLANFDAELDVIVTSTGAIVGDFTATIAPPDVYANVQSTHQLCVDADNVVLSGVAVQTGLHVANCVITVIPTGLVGP